ncbi:MAG: hypothetical protein UH241_04635 [Acutalibacteraceae bacterium]|nr:hypothetical protein [Acutalibacteraceae bacterium]
MSYTTFLEHLMGSTEYSTLFGASDMFRMILVGVACILRSICDAVEYLYSSSYKIFGFLYSDEFINVIAPYKPFILAGIAVSIFLLGMNLIIKGDEVIRKGSHKKAIQNVLLLIILLVGVPLLLTGTSPYTQYKGTISGINLKNHFVSDTADSMYNITAGNVDGYGRNFTQADLCAAEAMTDIEYIIFNNNYWNYSMDNSQFNSIKNPYVRDGYDFVPIYDNCKGAFDYLVANSIDYISCEEIDRMTDGGEAFNRKKPYNMQAIGASGLPEENNNDPFWKVYLYHHWSVIRDGNKKIYIGDYYEPLPLNGMARGDLPYQITVDWLNFFISLLIVTIMMIATAYKIIKLIFDLAFNYLFSAVIAPFDLTGGQKIKEIIMSSVGIVVCLWFSGVVFQIFCAGRQFLNSQDWLSGQPIAKNIILIFIALACIQGPELLKKILGVDGGLAKSMATVAGAGMVAGAIAKAPAKAIGGASRHIAQFYGSSANAYHSGIARATEKFVREGVPRSETQSGKSNSRLKNEYGEQMAINRQQRVDDAIAGRFNTRGYQERTKQRQDRLDNIKAKREMQNETQANQATARMYDDVKSGASQNLVASRYAMENAEARANVNYRDTDEGRTATEENVLTGIEANTQFANAEAQARENNPDIAHKNAVANAEREVTISSQTAEVMENNPSLAQRQANTNMRMETVSNNAIATAFNNNSQQSENLMMSRANAEIASNNASINYKNTEQGKLAEQTIAQQEMQQQISSYNANTNARQALQGQQLEGASLGEQLEGARLNNKTSQMEDKANYLHANVQSGVNEKLASSNLERAENRVEATYSENYAGDVESTQASLLQAKATTYNAETSAWENNKPYTGDYIEAKNTYEATVQQGINSRGETIIEKSPHTKTSQSSENGMASSSKDNHRSVSNGDNLNYATQRNISPTVENRRSDNTVAVNGKSKPKNSYQEALEHEVNLTEVLRMRNRRNNKTGGFKR